MPTIHTWAEFKSSCRQTKQMSPPTASTVMLEPELIKTTTNQSSTPCLSLLSPHGAADMIATEKSHCPFMVEK